MEEADAKKTNYTDNQYRRFGRQESGRRERRYHSLILELHGRKDGERG